MSNTIGKGGGLAGAIHQAELNDGKITANETDSIIKAGIDETLALVDLQKPMEENSETVGKKYEELRAVLDGTSTFAPAELAKKTGDQFETQVGEAFFQMLALGIPGGGESTAAVIESAMQSGGSIDETEVEAIVKAAVGESLSAIDQGADFKANTKLVEAKETEVQKLVDGATYSPTELGKQVSEAVESQTAEAFFMKMAALGKLPQP